MKFGASYRTTTTYAVTFHFVPGATLFERDAFLHEITADINTGAQRRSLHVDRHQISINNGNGEKAFKRGDPAPFDFVAMFDSPIWTFAFDVNRVAVKRQDKALEALSDATTLEDATMLFPELPKHSITRGFKWKTTKEARIPGLVGSFELICELEYIGDSACPSAPTKTCAQIEVRGWSNDAPFVFRDVRGKLMAAYAGKIFFNVEDGIVDESRLISAANLNVDEDVVEFDGKITVKPVVIDTP